MTSQWCQRSSNRIHKLMAHPSTSADRTTTVECTACTFDWTPKFHRWPWAVALRDHCSGIALVPLWHSVATKRTIFSHHQRWDPNFACIALAAAIVRTASANWRQSIPTPFAVTLTTDLNTQKWMNNLHNLNWPRVQTLTDPAFESGAWRYFEHIGRIDTNIEAHNQCNTNGFHAIAYAPRFRYFRRIIFAAAMPCAIEHFLLVQIFLDDVIR